ncbi:MAG: hypothetical protein OEO23_10820 [Gemmatimonadota bacterium]|nr:hypothetical protein [Gemmatimonadota bacterium]
MQITFREQLESIYANMVVTVAEWVPRLLALAILIVVGLVVARITERLLASFLRRVKFDELLQRAGADRTLHRLGVRRSIDELVPRIVYFLILFLLAKTAADTLKLVAVSSAITSLMSYLPNLVGALLILVVGGAGARLARSGIEDLAEGWGFMYPTGLARAASGLVLFVFGVMAMAQLEIDTIMIRWAAMAFMAGAVATFAISFGLGSRDITRNMLAGMYARNVFKPGMILDVDGRRGVLTAITPTQTLLSADGKIVSFANARFLEAVTEGEEPDPIL